MPFRSLAGHRRLTALLSRAIGRGTLPPTLLFTGPSGVGKWRAAVATAQTLNCLTPVQPAGAIEPTYPGDPAQVTLGLDACGECRPCERIARGIHVDVIAIEPDDKASIKIDVIREVLSRTSTTRRLPSNGR